MLLARKELGIPPATGANSPDALAGGVRIAAFGGPLLLVPPTGVDASVAPYLGSLPDTLTVFVDGGTTALPANVDESLR